MASLNTPNELLALLKSFSSGKDAVDSKKLKYVIYVRKSTDEKDKQIRSLSDQILECKDFAEKYNLRWVEILDESESAKEPDIRPKFRLMLENLKKGKYDGIIAWHPDRLARNMKDAGEIIDLVDKQIIKDLKFVSFTFNNDTSGKMLLGITFVLSKEYSDKLSDNVDRGNRRSIEEGKYINKAKHGYLKDVNQRLQPDGQNFILIKNAFMMRLREHKTLDEIADYLNQNDYRRSDAKKPEKMTKQKVEKFMKDPVYTGILYYGKNVVNLMELYDFISMITTDEFMQINKLFNNSQIFRLAKSYRKNENVKADLMRGMILCSECGETMSAGITPKKQKDGKTTNYFYYRCETEDCVQCNKSVRAKVIVDYIYQFLNSNPFASKRSYEHYVVEMKRVSDQRLLDAKSGLSSLFSQKRSLAEKEEKIKKLLLDGVSPETREVFEKDLKENKAKLVEVEKNIQKTKEFIDGYRAGILTYAEFLELMENIPKNMAKIKSMKDLDFVCKKIFLNFSIKDKNVEKSTLNEPFGDLYGKKVLTGAR